MKIKTLIVDDEIEFHELYEDFLSSTFEVKFAVDVDSALVTVVSWQPNVVVTDLKLPSKTGIELLRFLERFPQIGKIAMTGYPEQFVKKLFNETSVDRFLAKPIENPIELIQMIVEAFDIAKNRFRHEYEPNTNSESDAELLTVDEVGELLRIGRTTVFKLARENGLTSIKVGGSRRFKKADVLRWLQNNPNL